ncbi:MAG: LPS biosynthesis rfbu related protein [Candidatus Nitrosocaldaceae archaeon]|nr:MAG: LPS biosynthesis rfbu related protein [Candidatus Nitrosocaldaceae archaeon]
MKILVTTPYFYPEGGGLERYAYNIFKRLVKKGYEINVFCSTKNHNKDIVEELDGLIIHRLKPDVIISNTPIRLNLLKILSDEIKNGYDIVNSHTPVPYFAEIAALVARRNNIDYIVTFHVADMVSPKPLLNIISKMLSVTIEPMIFKNAKKIITVSELVKNNYLIKFANKTEVIPPGVDTERYKPSIYNPDAKKLLFISSLSSSYEWKGLRILLDAMPSIIKRHPDATLTIVGDGPLKQEFMQICRTKQINKNVIFKGRLSEEDLIKAYQSSALVIMPSTANIDSFPLVLLEANACGVPVIASKIGGIPYYVKDGINGFLIEPRNNKMLAEKIIELLSNPNLLKELSVRSREIALEFDWYKVIDATEQLFAECMNEHIHHNL